MATISAYKLTNDLRQKSRMLSVAGDETRIRILCVLFQKKSPCVTDISKNLGESIACVSHHLQILKDGGLVKTQRAGNKICYELVKSDFVRQLKTIICR